MDSTHAAVGLGGISATAMLTTLLTGWHNLDAAHAAAAAGLTVGALGTFGGYAAWYVKWKYPTVPPLPTVPRPGTAIITSILVAAILAIMAATAFAQTVPADPTATDMVNSMTATDWAVKSQRNAVAAFARDRYADIEKLKTDAAAKAAWLTKYVAGDDAKAGWWAKIWANLPVGQQEHFAYPVPNSNFNKRSQTPPPITGHKP
jgi:glucan phosphoethanolaminetransferase (alkaline phosphatase superfamily)